AEAGMLVTLLVAGKSIIGRTLALGGLTTFAGFQFRLLWLMIALGWVSSIAQRGVVCLGRIGEILDARPDSDDARAVADGGPIEGRIEAPGLTIAHSPPPPPRARRR